MRQTELSEILSRTSGGLTVFTHYLGEKCLSKKFCNPFREDHHPSCRLYRNKAADGTTRYYMKDFANDDYYEDCFWMVSKYLNLSLSEDFKSILETIDHDLSLGVFARTPKAVKGTIDYAKRMEEKYKRMEKTSIESFTLKIREFNQSELDYWMQYGITVEILNRFNVKGVESCTIVKKDGKSFSVFSSIFLPLFAYCFDNGKGYKIYRPKAASRFMYLGRLPNPYIFGWEQLPASGDMVFITGGEKDVMSLAAHGFSAISFNSETAKIPTDALKDLFSRFRSIIVLFDSDETGIKESASRCEENKDLVSIKRVVLPLKGDKTEKDISDFFKIGRTAENLLEVINSQQTPYKAK